jgi:hypothetical protein
MCHCGLWLCMSTGEVGEVVAVAVAVGGSAGSPNVLARLKRDGGLNT